MMQTSEDYTKFLDFQETKKISKKFINFDFSNFTTLVEACSKFGIDPKEAVRQSRVGCSVLRYISG